MFTHSQAIVVPLMSSMDQFYFPNVSFGYDSSFSFSINFSLGFGFGFVIIANVVNIIDYFKYPDLDAIVQPAVTAINSYHFPDLILFDNYSLPSLDPGLHLNFICFSRIYFNFM
jgi:hypothetical protein